MTKVERRSIASLHQNITSRNMMLFLLNLFILEHSASKLCKYRHFINNTHKIIDMNLSFSLTYGDSVQYFLHCGTFNAKISNHIRVIPRLLKN